MFSRAELCEGALPMVQHTAVQLHKDNRIPEPPGKTEKSNSWVQADQSKPLWTSLEKTSNLLKRGYLCIKAVLKVFQHILACDILSSKDVLKKSL